MNFLFRETYWAGILILAGILLVLRNVFKLDIPVMGVIFPVIIISWGINILMGSKPFFDIETNVVFHNGQTTTVHGRSQHNVAFGKGDYDLRNIQVTTENVRVDVDAVFSTASVRIDPRVPTRVKASSVFGSARLPDGSMVSFGDRTYYTKAYREGSPYVDVRADVVFGEMRIIEDSVTTVNSSPASNDDNDENSDDD
jgi:hypothetical protein